jgi:hypothetical protein
MHIIIHGRSARLPLRPKRAPDAASVSLLDRPARRNVAITGLLAVPCYRPVALWWPVCGQAKPSHGKALQVGRERLLTLPPLPEPCARLHRRDEQSSWH